MIHGIGTDIVEIERIKLAVERRGQRFLDRVFTPDEISYCYRRKNPFPHLAARFAAKEAMVKALTKTASSGGLSEVRQHHVSLNNFEIVNDPTGKPSMKVTGSLKSYIEDLLLTIHISVAHERSFAVATVVLETTGL